MQIQLNGKDRELPDGATIVDALQALGLAANAKGVAVAAGDRVVPRSEWSETRLREGEPVEVVTAAQGG